MELPFTDDSVTWQLFKNGDKKAFSFIYTTYSPNLYEYGMRILQDEELTRDAIHDLFVKLWQNRKSIGTTNNIKYYLITALRNTIFTLKGIENRMQLTGLNEADAFHLDFTLESAYIRKEDLNLLSIQLLDALNQISPRQKEILYLRYFEELDYNQIAEMMNISVKGAYKLSARALEALRELMKLPLSLLLFLLLMGRERF
ncbi:MULTISPECIES: RNA polymerase sigma factor [Pedobacter]|uniref:RNA polymerase sigma factor, sigma-70 family n=1 Tax=Pedobacter heparinus (strain ATCC 13125 / DSM 2366 / CIP 104194 / JCM 7457 / NBRC 12017 / NCIMB 9290 / NRRL B-14731 / HIM 762-3) TaxID=485917 RepID=C6XXN2_PEDHD|nr:MULTISPECIES: sigma-70 family RNA polymerase sigma factor [Pedobacter]ACU02286.1 RNA polymerase sigma factor, sigma-70 family [Pedobacter heparinus DSM 2366]MBB5437091.1 RNA polymerase sigma factor (sigma-70 family) [Pedobacter sp. AK017]